MTLYLDVKLMVLHFCTSVMKGVGRSSEVERSLMVWWVVGSILHGVSCIIVRFPTYVITKSYILLAIT